ncbi:phosphatase domain-containing protein [Zeaxanthinibacter enoshimensis]|uniref:phosphatase domain-containing protein n=1 Tax=Zeaxanthinibacter enoshimensis TaxID=392009 RepID=UPI0035626D3C
MGKKTSIYIWQITALEFTEKVWIEGTVIHGDHKQRKVHATWMGHLIEVLFSYFRKPASGVRLRIRTNTEEQTVKTNRKGRFSCLLDNFMPGEMQLSHQGEILELPGGYPYYFPQNSSSLEVVSDLDDTVLHSHTASALKRIYSILFILPRKRKAVAYTYQLMEWFKQQHIRVTYLSKSESNLFELIYAFINTQELPKGALLLSPYLKLYQLPKPKKGKDYKYNHLKTLLTQQPDKSFILIGDDTQRDMEVYTSIIRNYPGRIQKVFIRQSSFDRQREDYWQKLQATGVPAIYFKDGDKPGEAIGTLTSILNRSAV